MLAGSQGFIPQMVESVTAQLRVGDDIIEMFFYRLLHALYFFVCSVLALIFFTSKAAYSDNLLYAHNLLHRSIQMPLNKTEFLKLQNSLLNLGLPSISSTRPSRYSSRTSFSVTPIVKHEGNINGGNPVGPLRVSGVTFQLDEQLERKSDLAAGFKLQVANRRTIAIGHTLRFSAMHSSLNGMSYGNKINKFSIGVCTEKLFSGWRYANACLSKYKSEKLYSAVDEDDFLLSIGKVLQGKNSQSYKISTTISSKQTQDFQQYAVELKTHLLLQNDHEIIFSSRRFTGEDDFFSSTLETSVGAKLRIWDKDVVLNYTKTNYVGPNFFGQARFSSTEVIKISLKPLNSLTFAFGFETNNDSINFFDSKEPIFEMQFTPLRF